MWKNCIEDAKDSITLHDCIVNSVEFSDNILSLTLNDGFWMLTDSKYNPCGETVRADKSKVNFINYDENMSALYVFRKHYLFGKRLGTTRKKLELKTFFDKINSGEWEIEINEQYNAFHRVLFFGGVTTRKKIWALEFQLVIECDKIEYCWNDICPNRKW